MGPPAADVGAAAETAPTEAEAEQGELAELPADAVAESPAESAPAETAAEPVPAETAAETAPAETEAEQGELAELPADAVTESPAETAPAEADAEQDQLAEPAGEGVAEVAAEQPLAGPPPETAEPAEEEPESEKMDWYILNVQSNREDPIREGLLRRVAIAGLGRYFGQVIVPTEKVTEFKGGKKRVTKRKLYPGYLAVQMEINDDTWFLVRETPGIGDFTGPTGRPTPLPPHEVSRILATEVEKAEKAPKLKISFSIGDHVKINKKPWVSVGQEGDVVSIDEGKGEVKVQMNIFGRTVLVDFGYWELETT